MTEISGNKGATPKRHLIDPLMFFLALVGAPLLVTAMTFWMLLVPVAALVLGGPVYLIVGTPLLMWWLGRAEPKILPIAALALVANLLACAGIYLFYALQGFHDPWGPTAIYAIFGSIFAPVWSGVFAWLYRSWRRPFFEQTV